MLESINIKQVASYDDTGIQITGLKKVNYCLIIVLALAY